MITQSVRGGTSWTQLVERWRILIVAGVPVGVIVAGIGGRVAMFVLRLTSPSSVRGVTSDDGFTIGEFTLGGTYSLLALGAVVGLVGVVAYWAVAPWLIGPVWFRRATIAAASGAVVGSMLIHEDGVDFTLLGPTWLAIGLFIALPAVFGWVIGPVVEAVSSADSWTATGRARWLLPAMLLVLFPPAAFALVLLGLPIAVWTLGHHALADGMRVPGPGRMAIRAGWLAIAGLGLIALVNDITAIA